MAEVGAQTGPQQGGNQARDPLILLTTKTQDFFGASECTVRVNSIQSGLCHDDLDEILATPTVKKFVEPFLLPIPWVF